MIIVKLIGGLGNQLFQYAAGLQLSKFYQTTLRLDTSAFETYKLHRYSLAPFCIQENFANPEEIAKVKWGSRRGINRLIFLVRQRMKPYYQRTVFCESTYTHYDPDIRKTPRDVYLNGYWQSERYFKDIEGIIRDEFTIKIEPDSMNKQMAKTIDNVNAVSLHIRRSDYVTNATTNKVHGVCSIEYYRQAVEIIADKVSSPHFFIFSDDIVWAKENIRLEYLTTFMHHNDASKNYEDMRLMSLCKHHIIANSTFSWWGAWLCKNPNQIVIAPKKWFNKEEINTADLIPERWIRI